jgi:hypothetical protein
MEASHAELRMTNNFLRENNTSKFRILPIDNYLFLSEQYWHFFLIYLG